jgi:hypothetical protein
MDGGLIFSTAGRPSKPSAFDIALQVTGNTPGNGMDELCDFIAGRALIR